MRSLILDIWSMPEKKVGVIMPRVAPFLGSPFAIAVLGLCFLFVAIPGVAHGDFRLAWLGVLGALAWWLISRDIHYGFFLLGVAWTLSIKVPLPWKGLGDIPVRADDIFTVLLLLHVAGCWRRGPLDKPILRFLTAALISMFAGLWQRTLYDPWQSLFNAWKWGQYFLLYGIAYQTKNPFKGMVYVLGGMFNAALLLAVFGFWEHFHPLAEVFVGNYYRLFERPPFLAQANHFGIFLGMCLSFALPFFLRLRRGLVLLALWGAGLAVSFALFWTYSRMSYAALALSFLTICCLARRARLVLVALCLLLAPVVLSPRVGERVTSIKGTLEQNEFSSSVTARFVRWQTLWKTVQEYPLLGTGIGSRDRAFYESFWMQLLCETGVAGVFFYLGILAIGLRALTAYYRGKQGVGDLDATMLLGFAGVFVALIFTGASLVDFVITAIAAPFWTCFGFLLRAAADSKIPAGVRRPEAVACT